MASRRISDFIHDWQPLPTQIRKPSDDMWHERAACATADRSIFYPASPISEDAFEEAAQYCRVCPVIYDCLMASLTYESVSKTPHGIWGGHLPTSRDYLRRDAERIEAGLPSQFHTMLAHGKMSKPLNENICVDCKQPTRRASRADRCLPCQRQYLKSLEREQYTSDEDKAIVYPVKYKPCPVCGEDMPYKHKRKTMCMKCKKEHTAAREYKARARRLNVCSDCHVKFPKVDGRYRKRCPECESKHRPTVKRRQYQGVS